MSGDANRTYSVRSKYLNLYYNLADKTTAQKIINRGDLQGGVVDGLIIANLNASSSVTVSVYLERILSYESVPNDDTSTRKLTRNFNTDTETTYTFYIIKNVSIPPGVSLKLDKEEMNFDSSYYSLYVIKSESTDVDVSVHVTGRKNK